MTRKEKLRQICRGYLQRLYYIANKHGLTSWLNQAIKDTKRRDCEPTEKECEMLSRIVNDERLTRVEVPPLLSKPYNQCIDNDDFDKIKKLKRVGIYSKVDTMLYAESLKEKQKKIK
jgi:hypothetical protein